ncbi:MAG: heavy-metal-associated domain-containing protein [Candidatus Krumholzibacteriia bacterium]
MKRVARAGILAADRQGQSRIALRVEGMTCEGCASTVRTALVGITGVIGVEVNVAESRALVTVDSGHPPSTDVLVAAVNKTGYSARPWEASVDGALPLEAKRLVEPEISELRLEVETAASDAAALKALSPDGRELKALFNQNAGAVRLVTLLEASAPGLFSAPAWRPPAAATESQRRRAGRTGRSAAQGVD